jgi:hypothetical protein
LICVLVVNLAIPLDIIKQQLLEIIFHPKVREMIIDETHVQKQIQDLTIASWTITKEEQLTSINLGAKTNLQHVKMNVLFEPVVS